MLDIYIKGDVYECKTLIKTLYDLGWKCYRMTDFSPLEYISTDGVVYMEVFQ